MSALVLFYHRVGPFSSGAARKMNVEPAVFREQLGRVAERWKVTTLDEVVDCEDGASAITFDDGYRDVMEHALPVLRELKMSATFFIVTDAIGKRDSWYHNHHEIVSWDDLKRWVDAGMQVGSHGVTHRRLTDMSIEAARAQIEESKRVLEEKLGVKVAHFSYPQGRRTREIEEMIEKAGYRAAWGTKGAPGTPFARRRIRLSANDRGFRFAFKLWKFRWGLY